VSETGKPVVDEIGVITNRLECREECALTPVLVKLKLASQARSL